MSKAPHYQDYSLAGFSAMMRIDADGYSGGYIMTPQGVVGFYRQTGRPYTSLTMAFNGRSYDVSWDRFFTDRRLKTLAKRFAAQTLARVGEAP